MTPSTPLKTTTVKNGAGVGEKRKRTTIIESDDDDDILMQAVENVEKRLATGPINNNEQGKEGAQQDAAGTRESGAIAGGSQGSSEGTNIEDAIEDA